MRSPAVFPSMGKGPSLLMVIDGFLPVVTQLEDSGVVTQCVACEYAGCICIVVVIVVVRYRLLTRLAIDGIDSCFENLINPYKILIYP
jgi:hypothetical protein